MTRFLHSADWQIGMAAKHAGSKAKQVRDRRFESAEKIVRLAKERSVDFVLLAGDTFEYESPGRLDVKKTVDILNSFAPIPVYVLPGNHDPLRPGSVWDMAEWRAVGPHITLLKEAAEFALENLPGVVLYPCPLKQKESKEDPTAWIPAREKGDNRVRIGVGHGGLKLRDDYNFPIAPDRSVRSGLDYLALGDWHSTYGHVAAVGTWYSGTHETTSFKETDSGNVLIVEIEAGQPATVEKVRVGRLCWLTLEPEIETREDVRRLEEEAKREGALGDLLIRVRPKMSADVDTDARDALELLRQELQEDALVCDWEQDEATLLEEVTLPPGTLQEADRLLAAGDLSAYLDFAPTEDELAAARALLRKTLREVTK